MTSEISVTVDRWKFDGLQHFLVGQLVKSIRMDLERAGLEMEVIRKLTSDLTFSVTAIIDASTRIEKDGKPVRPFLTFAMDEDSTDLIATEYCSSMHEYAVGLADESFED